MKSKLVDAFIAASDGFSPDRVVADPDVNSRFITACRDRGLVETPAALNRALLNLRKTGGLSGLRPSIETRFKEQEGYGFAAEMAARFLERREATSLDVIICDPTLAAEFDKLAAQIAPGYQPLQYRWAALNLRKAKKLRPELLARVVQPIEVRALRVDGLNLAEVPAAQGLYLFFVSNELLYVGEAENLRLRLKKHLDHSDNKGLARWMWDRGIEELQVEIQVLAKDTPTRSRKALELELIRSRSPVFNVKR